MDNYQGDLTDIVRGTGRGPHPLASCAAPRPPPASSSDHVHHSILFSTCSDPFDFIPSTQITNAFGNPFSTLSDPLLTELDAASNYFGGSPSQLDAETAAATETGALVYNSSNIVQTGFPRMQISPVPPPPKLPVSPRGSPPVMAPSATPRGVKASAVVPSDMINAKGCFLDGAQISSPRNLGIKKRLGKCQSKKVVCIPAPAAANSRSSGEVVPSDLWAWRKYGQKPIKGSPYPRGYYRCSSSKGCSARKQVERSRTDPNMLVITYTSEHNHPWPTQRNALAGSARSQPSSNSKTTIKNAVVSSTTSSSSDHQNKSCHDNNTSTSDPVGGVKQELDEIMEKRLDLDNQDHDDEIIFSSSSSTADQHHYQLFPHPYKPAPSDSGHNHQPEVDFFADLHELDPELLFPRPREEKGDHDDRKQIRNKVGAAAGDNVDFSFFDWPADQDDKRGL